MALQQHRVPAELEQRRDEIGDVGSALNTLIDSVDTALSARNDSERRLREFMADASHELRTPLAAMRGYAEMLQLSEPLSPSGRDQLKRVMLQSGRMSDLVESLLLLARLDAAEQLEHSATRTVPRRKQVDLGELVVDAAMDAHTAARSTTEGSTGLGLAIVRSVAQAHGGDVVVETRPGRTVFTVTLPTDNSYLKE